MPKIPCPVPECKRKFKTQVWLDRHMAKRHKGFIPAPVTAMSPTNESSSIVDVITTDIGTKLKKLNTVVNIESLPLEIIMMLVASTRP